MCNLFLFQAEDGIRDLTVTGVQTCALPISRLRAVDQRLAQSGRDQGRQGRPPAPGPMERARRRAVRLHRAESADREIGRASCRERGVVLGGRGIIKKKKSESDNILFGIRYI